MNPRSLHVYTRTSCAIDLRTVSEEDEEELLQGALLTVLRTSN